MPDRKPTTLRGAVDAEDCLVIARWLERHAIATESPDLSAALFQAAATYRLIVAMRSRDYCCVVMGELVERASNLPIRHPSQWQPGQSGNPKGRPKAELDIGALARSHAPEAMAALVLALDDPKTRVPAATAILDRGFGRPMQPVVDETEGTSLTLLHLIAARRVGEVLQAAMEGQSTNESGEAKAGTIDYTVPALE